MDNLHLFELINAPARLGEVPLMIAIGLAEWAIYLLPTAMAFEWIRGDGPARRELLQMLLAALLALGIASLVTHAYPQPRPFSLHLGTQYLEHVDDPGLPSDHVTVLWSVAFTALSGRRFAVWTFPLFGLGLLVGWARVYLGVHFPYDILAAFPVALAGSVAAGALREPSGRVVTWVLSLHDRLVRAARAALRRARRA